MSFLDQSERELPKWLKIPGGVLGIILIIVIVKSVGSFATEALSKEASNEPGNSSNENILNEEQVHNALIRIQDSIRGQLPIRVDPSTTLMDVIVVRKRISYVYSLNSEIPTEDIDQFIANVVNANRDNFCQNEGFRMIIDSGGSISWLYNPQSNGAIEAVLDSCT